MRVLTLTAIVALVLASGGGASAHDAMPAHIHRALEWSWEPWVLVCLGTATVLYVAGLVRLRRKLGPMRVISTGEIAAFAAGMATLFIALVSPIDSISEQLFSVHMVQHLLLLLVAPPLLVMSRPAIAFIWAFRPRQRRAIGRLWIGLGLGGGVRVLMHPLVVWVLFCGTFVFWHLPRPYQWALADETVHGFEHASFFITALMFWTIVIEPSGRRRLSYGTTLIFVMTTAILSAMPGALMALAPRPLYPAYAAGVAAWGLTLLEDQQLAGIIMWVPGGVVYLAAASWVFLRWLSQSEQQQIALARKAVALSSLSLLLVMLVLSGCGGDDQATAKSVGNIERGATLIRQYGCGSCHIVPGIQNATGLVGPPLNRIGSRIYIAGVLRNTPNNLISWLRDPQKIVPGNAMPDMGLSEQNARDVAAYLYTLQ